LRNGSINTKCAKNGLSQPIRNIFDESTSKKPRGSR
jgi:hypothetical protein